MEVKVSIDISTAKKAMESAPERMTAAISLALERGAQDLARSARAKAPKAFSTLTNSIRVDQLAPLHFRVATGVNYARPVEEGRKPGKMPGTAKGLAEWVRQKTGAAGKELDRRTFLVARAIARRGIKAQPFMAPSYDEDKDRIIARVRHAAAVAAQEINRG